MGRKGEYHKLFENYEAEPSPRVWERIAQQLKVNRKKRNGILFGGLSLLFIVITFTFGVRYYIQRENMAHDTQSNSQKSDRITRTTSARMLSSQTQNPFPAGQTSTSTQQMTASVNKIFSKTSKNASELRQEYRFKNEKIRIIPDKHQQILSGNQTIAENSNHIFTNTGNTGKHIEEIGFLASREYRPNYPLSAMNLREKEITGTTKYIPSLTRWQLILLIGEEKSYRRLKYHAPYKNTLNSLEKEYIGGSEKSISSITYSLEIIYDASPHVKVFSGIKMSHVGQERSRSFVYLKETVSTKPELDVYAIRTSVGEIEVNGQEFDRAYFKNTDSTLFNYRFVSTLFSDTSTVRNFSLSQELKLFTIPLGIVLEPNHRRITPFVGIFIAASFLDGEKLYVEDQSLKHSYSEPLKHWLWSAGIKVGLSFQLSKSLSIHLHSQYWTGLHSLSTANENSWVPYSESIQGGIGYRFSR